jgi:mannose-6-phosphate isomerase-like protein (cupin superfamily)
MPDSETVLRAVTLKPDTDHLAPDGSEIRLLPAMKGCGLCHCTLRVGRTSSPVAHRQVEEIWYVASGEGEVWRKNSAAEETVRVRAGSSLTIPPRTAFQFRNTGDSPLCILIVTMPPWPGPQEAEKAEGVWSVTVGAAADTGSANIATETGAQTRGRRNHK